MGIKQKTVFISYRRTNFYTALAIYQHLKPHGYDVFFDYQSLDSGGFEQVIFENIQHRAHFLIILSPSSLERLKEPASIMRREVEMAINEKRNIIPLTMEGFDFGNSKSKEALHGKLSNLSSYNAVGLVPEYFDACMEKLRRFLDVALEDVRLPDLSTMVEEDTAKWQVKAEEEPTVQEKSLTAEEWFERGYKNQRDGNHQEAIRYYKKALEISPNIPGAYSNLGIAFADLKRYPEAEEAYRKAIEIDPEFVYAYNGLGNVLTETERYIEAENAYRKAIEFDSEYGYAYNGLGNVLTETERYIEAENAYRKAIELKEYEYAYNGLGRLLYKIKRYEEAEATYLEAIEFNHEDPIAYFNLGILLRATERYEEAEEAYRKAIELNPEDATAYYNLGNLLSELKRYEEAEAAYRKAIELNPEDATAYYNLGNLLNMQERLHEAEKAFKKAVEIDPDDGVARMSLWGLLKKLGKKEEAKKHEQLARKLSKKENEYNRACFESLCGNIDEALALLKIAIEKGQSSLAWAKQDPDLENLRADPRFWEIIGEEMPKQ